MSISSIDVETSSVDMDQADERLEGYVADLVTLLNMIGKLELLRHTKQTDEEGMCAIKDQLYTILSFADDLWYNSFVAEYDDQLDNKRGWDRVSDDRYVSARELDRFVAAGGGGWDLLDRIGSCAQEQIEWTSARDRARAGAQICGQDRQEFAALVSEIDELFVCLMGHTTQDYCDQRAVAVWGKVDAERADRVKAARDRRAVSVIVGEPDRLCSGEQLTGLSGSVWV